MSRCEDGDGIMETMKTDENRVDMNKEMLVKDTTYTETKESLHYFDELLKARNELFDKKWSDPEAHKKFMEKCILR